MKKNNPECNIQNTLHSSEKSDVDNANTLPGGIGIFLEQGNR